MYTTHTQMETIELNLVKKETFIMKPFGHFSLRWKVSSDVDKNSPNVLKIDSIQWDWNQAMPVTPDDEKVYRKFMKKNKTEILTNLDGNKFYTRMSYGWVEVNHRKLNEYRRFLREREFEDNEQAWKTYLNK